MTYPKPATPLPWHPLIVSINEADLRYLAHAANTFPRLVAALEELRQCQARSYVPSSEILAIIDNALAIARGEVAP